MAGRPRAAVGVIGLGTGGLGCYAPPGEAWTFHEIDANVRRMASDDRYLHVLSWCGRNPQNPAGRRATDRRGPSAGNDLTERARDGWRTLPATGPFWTDDRSNIVSVLRW